MKNTCFPSELTFIALDLSSACAYNNKHTNTLCCTSSPDAEGVWCELTFFKGVGFGKFLRHLTSKTVCSVNIDLPRGMYIVKNAKIMISKHL